MSAAPSHRPRLVYVVTHSQAARMLLRGQPGYMRRRGFDVTVICAPGPQLDEVREREGVTLITVPLLREIDPLRDVRALAALIRVFRQIRPDIVSAGTVKAGLLGTLAARIVGVPVCTYTLRGLRLETATGFQRALLTLTEHIAARSAHRVIAVSPSLAALYADSGFALRRKITVIGEGSSNGVDVERFAATPETAAAAERLRSELGIPADAQVIGFVGRFTRDKGIEDLVAAFERIHADRPNTRLLLVGDFESGDPVPPDCADRMRTHPGIVLPGFVTDVAPYYHLMDVLAFPSRREGFPNAPLEAAAAGVPTVGCRATGTVDAVVDGTTGAIVEPHDPEALAAALLPYLDDRDLQAAHGAAARSRAVETFASERIWSGLAEAFEALLRERDLPLPRPPHSPATSPATLNGVGIRNDLPAIHP